MKSQMMLQHLNVTRFILAVTLLTSVHAAYAQTELQPVPDQTKLPPAEQAIEKTPLNPFQQEIATLKQRIKADDSRLQQKRNNKSLSQTEFTQLNTRLRRIERAVIRSEHQGFLTPAGRNVIMQSLDSFESSIP